MAFAAGSLLDLAEKGLYEELFQALSSDGGSQINTPIDGWTLLQRAAYGGQVLMCMNLVKQSGAKVDLARNVDGSTALIIAVCEGHVDTIGTLAMLGANVNHRMPDGSSPIAIAAGQGQHLTVQALHEYGADPDLQRHDGQSALHVAVASQRSQAVKTLISLGCNCDLQDLCGFTPIHIACEHGHIEIVNFLVEASANLNLATADGITPLAVATEKKHSSICKVLKKAGAVLKVSALASKSSSGTRREKADRIRRTLSGETGDMFILDQRQEFNVKVVDFQTHSYEDSSVGLQATMPQFITLVLDQDGLTFVQRQRRALRIEKKDKVLLQYSYQQIDTWEHSSSDFSFQTSTAKYDFVTKAGPAIHECIAANVRELMSSADKAQGNHKKQRGGKKAVGEGASLKLATIDSLMSHLALDSSSPESTTNTAAEARSSGSKPTIPPQCEPAADTGAGPEEDNHIEVDVDILISTLEEIVSEALASEDENALDIEWIVSALEHRINVPPGYLKAEFDDIIDEEVMRIIDEA